MMLVFWKEKLVVFSMPKTGTSAIDQVLTPRADIAITAPPVLKHMPVYRFHKFMTPLFDKVDAGKMAHFAMIRDPFDWLGSWYKYRARAELDGTETSTKPVSFDDFVLACLERHRPPFANIGSQLKFLSGGEITHLFRYESMPKAVTFLEDRLNVTLDLPQVNISPPRQFSLSKTVADRYRAERAQEFDLWENAIH